MIKEPELVTKKLDKQSPWFYTWSREVGVSIGAGHYITSYCPFSKEVKTRKEPSQRSLR